MPVAYLLCFFSFNLTAQVTAPLNQQVERKPFLFAALPDTITVNRNSIEKLFSSTASGDVKIAVESNKSFEGKILERVWRSESVTTLNITLTNYQEALFTISRINDQQGEKYIGRIVNKRFDDVLILVNEGELLFLVKQKQSLFLTE